MASEARDRLDAAARERDPEHLLAGRRRPLGWLSWTALEKLDYIATRMIMEDRAGIRSHNALKEHAVLSPDQYRRRLRREVYSSRTETGDLHGDLAVVVGIFGRSKPISKRGGKESTGNVFLPGPPGRE